MVGAVGKDAFAAQATALLTEGGVDLSAVRAVDAPTGTALILVGGDGENMIAVVPGANAAVCAADARGAELGQNDCVLLQNETPHDAAAAALQCAREAGALSLLNLAPFSADIARLAPQADIAVANETEFDLLAGELALPGADRPARMRAYAARTGRIVVVTLGGDGVAAATPEAFLSVPAMPIEPVDTVGAGDTFCGYLAHGLNAGMTLEAAIRRAGIAGSLACLKADAQPSIPLAAEVDAAMKG